MIPVRSSIHPRNYPLINVVLIFINIFVFWIEISQGPLFDRFVVTYSLIPARYSNPDLASYFSVREQFASLLSFMFLHGNFWHLLGNMWFLYIFGGNVEDRLGHLRYIAFYIACGLASGLVHVMTNLHSTIPTIGASGAIAGVMGAYFVLYPRTRIITLILIIFIPYFIEIPAVIFLGIWAIMQLLSATLTDSQITGGIAWWAHVGGFVTGAVLVKMLDLIPKGNVSRRMSEATVKERSPLMHLAKQREVHDEGLQGVIAISPREAARGTRKLVSVPGRFGGGRFFHVTIPPGTENGTMLRLRDNVGTEKKGVALRIVIQPERYHSGQ